MNILTENYLRGLHLPSDCKEYHVSSDTFIVPLAAEYLSDHGIALVRDANGTCGEMTVVPIRDRGGNTYIDAATGKGMAEKPEDMTHLRGNLLVSKNDPRIAFRGKLDCLEAEIICVQILAREKGYEKLYGELEETLVYVRKILAAEVKEEPLGEPALFGMGAAQLRYATHHVRESFGVSHVVPGASMGEVGARLNCLRTQARECELYAMKAFSRNGNTERPDIIQALNRLSSGFYILVLKLTAGLEE